MNAKDCTVQLLVTVEFLSLETDAQFIDSHIEEIKDRIKFQLVSHRTEKRLADTVKTTTVHVHTISREM